MVLNLHVSVSDDSTDAKLSFSEDGQTNDFKLSLEQVTELIKVLGGVRQLLSAEHPLPPIEGAKFTPVRRTNWAIQPEVASDGSLFAFQHPAFGPVGLVLTPIESEQLIKAMQQHLQIGRMGSTTARPN